MVHNWLVGNTKLLFEKCAIWLLKGDRNGWIVCHGFALGEWTDEIFLHCWLEHPGENIAVDLTTRPRVMSGDVFRKESDLFTVDEFTADQLAQMIGKHNSFGPFDPELKKCRHRILH